MPRMARTLAFPPTQMSWRLFTEAGQPLLLTGREGLVSESSLWLPAAGERHQGHYSPPAVQKVGPWPMGESGITGLKAVSAGL